MVGRTITSKVALSQKLKHPFSKLCSPGAKYSDTADTTRLRTVAAWYLVASGTPLNTIFGNASDFYRRFQGTLLFIAKNMGAAAAIPPKKDMPAQLTQNERDLKSQRDELLKRNQEVSSRYLALTTLASVARDSTHARALTQTYNRP
jgi:hypothetical protein